jgi:capsular polysaccharide transport system permease protein
MLVLFCLAVFAILPTVGTAVYLWGVAHDQYASTVAFSVRKDEAGSADLLSGLTRLTGSATSDTDILYEFIRSQELVAQIDAEIGLRALWGKAWPGDPLFGFDASGTIEDLHSHWLWMTDLSYDGATGLITLRANAFAAEDARGIATAVFDASSRMINEISDIARDDATRYAREELDRAVARLTEARQAMTTFRLRAQIVDIESDIQGQMGLLNTLQAQLAEVLIEQDLLRETARPDDPRIRQAEQRIGVIETRIRAERAKFGEGGTAGPGGEDYARLVAEFEALTVDREFAETSYRSAQASYDRALAEAQRQSRYLAAHIRPSLAERSMYPQRWILQGLAMFFLIALWGLGSLIYYSIRDRR